MSLLGTAFINPDGTLSELTFYIKKWYVIAKLKSRGWYSVLKPEFDANLQITIAPDIAPSS